MEHPITPPPELVEQWRKSGPADAAVNNAYEQHIATQAARWGADQELKACEEWLPSDLTINGESLRAARRPKPPSLAEEALTLLDDASTRLDAVHENTIRRALERLQELERGNE